MPVIQATGQTTKTTTQTITASSTATDTDSNYSFTASFDKERFDIIKPLIIKSLGKPNENIEMLFLWNLKNVYTITLHTKGMTITLDKKNAAASVVKTIETLVIEIQKCFSSAK